MTDQDDAIWIKTAPAVNGSTYVVNIEFSNDRAMTLNKGAAMRYASTVLAAAARAEHDAAVFAQMSNLVSDFEAVAEFIRDLRKDRPPLDNEALAPMRLDPGVNPEGEPFLALFLDGRQRGQWTVADAREHAMVVVETVEVADLDSAYFRALVGLVGVEPGRAHNVVGDLANYRPGGNQ